MQSTQGELREVHVVTETDVERAQSKSLRARAHLDDTECRLSDTVQRQRELTKDLKSHGRIRKLRQLCDAWTTRKGAFVLVVLIASMVVLVLSHAIGLPLLIWTIPNGIKTAITSSDITP